VLIETSNETRHALDRRSVAAAHRNTPLKGVLVGSPPIRRNDDVGEALTRPVSVRRKVPASVSFPTNLITASIMRFRPSPPPNSRRRRW